MRSRVGSVPTSSHWQSIRRARRRWVATQLIPWAVSAVFCTFVIGHCAQIYLLLWTAARQFFRRRWPDGRVTASSTIEIFFADRQTARTHTSGAGQLPCSICVCHCSAMAPIGGEAMLSIRPVCSPASTSAIGRGIGVYVECLERLQCEPGSLSGASIPYAERTSADTCTRRFCSHGIGKAHLGQAEADKLVLSPDPPSDLASIQLLERTVI